MRLHAAHDATRNRESTHELLKFIIVFHGNDGSGIGMRGIIYLQYGFKQRFKHLL